MIARTLILLATLALLSAPARAQAGGGVDPELEDIARLFIEKGELAQALEVYDELRLANPNDLDVLETTLELCRKIPACKPQLNKRLQMLQDFIVRNPKSTEARQVLVNYALELKQFKKARAAIKGLVKSKPESLENWLLLADHQEEVRNFRELDALLVRLRKRFPKSAEIWLRIADRAMAKDNNKRTRYALAMSKRLLKPQERALKKRHAALEREFRRQLKAAVEALHRDFRQDTRWADLEDDFDHSTYP